jgi:transcriptional regulator with XRE-family HTH domain
MTPKRRRQIEVGATIRKHREEDGLSLQQMAEHLHVRTATLEAWEQGHTHPNGKSIVRLCVWRQSLFKLMLPTSSPRRTKLWKLVEAEIAKHKQETARISAKLRDIANSKGADDVFEAPEVEILDGDMSQGDIYALVVEFTQGVAFGFKTRQDQESTIGSLRALVLSNQMTRVELARILEKAMKPPPVRKLEQGV